MNLLRCNTCKKIVTSEESVNHQCDAILTRFKTIQATSYFTVKDKSGMEYIIVDGLDGTGYRFMIKEPDLVPFSDNLDPSTESKHDEQYRQGNRTVSKSSTNT